ncbi:LysR family hydrogen peroxide-inducible transcriptional activator [Thermonema lapsum]|uniref:LysR family hydrogen peroxide-inducible transcriptional activator n=1 Tax=Thermonema lapsum TaxID=28195 RepID=A0A846MNQ4_9BACT|nr:hydrogen peroxide-inducible genes activator [Thermonema lapsum]NIK73042.1 LysR family hydrogen peroxide-inducible transcriptional activator [Thermonema lapsum]
MNLQQIHYLVALDEHRHFAKAAEACCVTQPTLTMQLKKLEEEIGFQIFDRSKRPIEPTEHGRMVIEKAKHIWNELNQLRAWLSEERSRLEGRYKVGVIPTLAPYLLPPFLKAWSRQHPEAYFEISEMTTERIIEALRSGDLDWALAVTPLDEADLREIPVFYEPFLLYLPPKSPLLNKKEISLEELNNQTLLLLQEGHCFREQALRLCGQDRPQTAASFELAAGSIETLKNMVKEGLGYTLVPYLSVQHETDVAFVRPLKGLNAVREVSLVVHRSFIKEQLLASVHALLRALVPAELMEAKAYRKVEWR